MAKRTVRELEVAGKRVLVRVDFNVPLDEVGRIVDDTRIRAALPTIEHLLAQGASAILLSHLGRPQGRRVPALSLAPVAERLRELLGCEVSMAPDCVGPVVAAQAAALQPGQVLLLENVRFHPQEEQNERTFAQHLAALGDVYVNDAFGAAHRAHASTEGVPRCMGAGVSGLLMEREISYLDETLRRPRRPFTAILGGAKISGKIELIEHLLDRVDALLIGGGMAYTFFKAMGLEIGDSLLEADRLDTARQLLNRVEREGLNVQLPADCVVADRFVSSPQAKVVNRDDIPPGWHGMDIGPKTRHNFANQIARGGTIVWNGPLGVCEMILFAQGTRQVAQALAAATREGALSIIGGGDTGAAIAQAGLAPEMTHISTGGGASLVCLSGRVLPGVAALDDEGS